MSFTCRTGSLLGRRLARYVHIDHSGSQQKYAYAKSEQEFDGDAQPYYGGRTAERQNHIADSPGCRHTLCSLFGSSFEIGASKFLDGCFLLLFDRFAIGKLIRFFGLDSVDFGKQPEFID